MTSDISVGRSSQPGDKSNRTSSLKGLCGFENVRDVHAAGLVIPIQYRCWFNGDRDSLVQERERARESQLCAVEWCVYYRRGVFKRRQGTRRGVRSVNTERKVCPSSST